MKEFFKKYGRFIFIFLFFLISFQFIVYYFNNDFINNYGFSYAIARGEVPYRDFNTVSTPLYSFIMSIGLLFFNNYLMFLIEHCILVTIMFYFLYELYGKKSYFLLLIICIMGFNSVGPTYNFLALFFLVIILYYEKKYSNKDYLIGVLIGLCFLSKQTIGVALIIPSIIFYFKDLKKLFRRFCGFIIPVLIFIIYLIINNALYQFIDLCFLGLFDFAGKNSDFFNSFFIRSIVIFIISLIISIHNRKDITNLYLLCGVLFTIPLFDFHHFSYFFLCFIMQIFTLLKVKNENLFSIICIVLSIIFNLSVGISSYISFELSFMSNFNHLNYILFLKNVYDTRMKYFDFFDSYDEPLIFIPEKMHYDIYKDNDIDYFDVLFSGNYGYNGSQKMIEKIKKYHNKYVIIDMDEYGINSQFDKVIVDYIIENSKFIETREIFNVYYLE